MSRPDVVVMDINMPVMNGIEATKRTKADFPDTPIIGLSVQREEELHDQIPDVGEITEICRDGMPIRQDDQQSS